ncbi:hypothetical protein C8J56DRAFT_468539 [Mycena floridula]|nr:hypothetical protein C8J56DRAFT_468539 [Mycena floridula]
MALADWDGSGKVRLDLVALSTGESTALDPPIQGRILMMYFSGTVLHLLVNSLDEKVLLHRCTTEAGFTHSVTSWAGELPWGQGTGGIHPVSSSQSLSSYLVNFSVESSASASQEHTLWRMGDVEEPLTLLDLQVYEGASSIAQAVSSWGTSILNLRIDSGNELQLELIRHKVDDTGLVTRLINFPRLPPEIEDNRMLISQIEIDDFLGVIILAGSNGDEDELQTELCCIPYAY